MLLVCKHESVQELLGGCRQLLGGCRQLLIKRSFVNAEPVSLGLSRRMGSWFAAIENLDLSGLNRQLADGIVVAFPQLVKLRKVNLAQPADTGLACTLVVLIDHGTLQTNSQVVSAPPK